MEWICCQINLPSLYAHTGLKMVESAGTLGLRARGNAAGTLISVLGNKKGFGWISVQMCSFHPYWHASNPLGSTVSLFQLHRAFNWSISSNRLRFCFCVFAYVAFSIKYYKSDRTNRSFNFSLPHFIIFSISRLPGNNGPDQLGGLLQARAHQQRAHPVPTDLGAPVPGHGPHVLRSDLPPGFLPTPGHPAGAQGSALCLQTAAGDMQVHSQFVV